MTTAWYNPEKLSDRKIPITESALSKASLKTFSISAGDGIAEVLFGDYNFKGKLPHSWPKSIEDYKGKYGPNFWDNTIEPLFKIGFGLTY